MKKYKSFIYLLLLLCAGYLISGCTEEDTEYSPLDILTGKEDVEAAYYKKNLVNPIKIEGSVSDYKTEILISGALIVIKENGSNIVYSTKSKADGTFNIYVEGNKDYLFNAYKDGYEKGYYFETNSDEIDTIINVNYNMSISYKMIVNDSIPLKNIEYISTRYLTKNINDLSFVTQGVIGLYYYTLSQFDANGNTTKTTVLQNYSDLIAAHDTFYWFGGSSDRTLRKYGQKGSKLFQTIYCQIPAGTYYDFEILNNSVWMISDTKLYKLSLNGDLLATYDFSDKIYDLSLIGLTKSGNFLYILNNATSYNYIHSGYCLYKFDTTSSSLVQKGYLPANMNTLDLSKLSFYNNSFWSIIDNGYNYDDLVKFEITN